MGFISLPSLDYEIFTIANIPSAASYEGEIIYISDVGTSGSYWISNGSYWNPIGGELTLFSDNVPVSLTGTTSESVLKTYTIKPILRENSEIQICILLAHTSNASSKTFRYRVGTVGSGLSGTSLTSFSVTTSTISQYIFILRNNNSLTSQKAWSTSSTVSFGNGVSATNPSLNTANSFDFNITGQHALGTNNITIKGVTVTVRI